jgi:hypothetical protein
MEPAVGGVITLTEAQWEALRARLVEDYRAEPSVMLIRGKMRRVLGFTVRHHQERQDVRRMPGGSTFGMPEYGVMIKDWICLDFYDGALETWFRLKYAEFLA